MSGRIAYYGNIVKDGLVLDLDAAKRDSYPGTGTTWSDISGNGNNGTLMNGPTFSSDNGGGIVFDGVNDKTSFSGGTFNYSPGTTGEISLEVWVYPTGPYTAFNDPPYTNLGCIFGQSYFNNSVGWGIGMATSGGINYFIWQVRNSSNYINAGTPVTSPFTNNKWYHIIGTFTRNSLSSIYINGVSPVSVSSVSLNGVSITPSLNDAAIAGGGLSNFYIGCRVSIARIYNRPLSSTEITQNYNAFKGRYGL